MYCIYMQYITIFINPWGPSELKGLAPLRVESPTKRPCMKSSVWSDWLWILCCAMRELLSSTACLHFEACLKASWEHTHLQSVMVDIGLKSITEGWRLRLPQRARWPSCMRMRRATRAAAAAPTPTSSQYSIPTKTYSSRLRYIAVAQHPPEQYLAATGVCGRAETRASAATLLRLVGA